MADNPKDEFDGWQEDEGSGFYGEMDDWFTVPEDPVPAANHEKEVTETSPAEEVREDRIYRETEPEEELAQWNTQEESTYTEYDPFFDPDIPDISRQKEQEEAPEQEEKPKKKFFFLSKQKPDEAPEKEPFFRNRQKQEEAPEKESFFRNRKKPGEAPEKSDRKPKAAPVKKKRPAVKKGHANSKFQGTFNKKLLVCIAAGAACAVAIFFIVFALLNQDPKKPDPGKTAELTPAVVTENASVTEIRHLSFPRLSADEKEGLLSVNEFSQILDNLYENGYVLVDARSIAEKGKDGNFTLAAHIEVPEGKKPLLLSQRDVPDVSAYDPGTFADGLMICEDGELRSQYTDADGNTAMGDLDVVPVLESFLREHPDFSFAGARGIAALTGYDGLVGKTSSDAAEVINLMKERGWCFASNGFKGISYGSEQSLVEEDANAWAEQVKPRIGDTDLIILPRATDLASWSPYTQENPKYTLLYGLGFRYFFVDAPETPGFLQVEKEYVRQAIIEIDTFSEYLELLEEGKI